MKGTYKLSLRDCIKITPRDYGWITDGHLALQTKAMKKPPKFTTNGFEVSWDSFKDCVLNLYPKSIEAWPMFYYLHEEGCNGVSPNPIPTENPKRGEAVVWVQSATGEWQSFNQHLFNHLRDMEPDFYMVVKENGDRAGILLIATKDNKPIGALMAMQTENLDHALGLAKEADLI